MKNTAKSKIKKFILAPIYFAVIAFLLFATIMQVFFSDRFIKVFGFQFFLISYTGSMEPFLNYNDLIVTKEFDFYQLKENDIITFYGKTLDGDIIRITHEIVEIQDDPSDGVRYLITKGKNKSAVDFIPVTVDGIYGTNTYIGKYVAKSEFVGNVFAYLQSTIGFIAVSINIVCGFMIYRVIVSEYNGENKVLF